jgi:protein TonB
MTGVEMEAIMYANRSSFPLGIRPIPFTAALLVNGAVIAGMVFFLAPQLVPSLKAPDPIKIIDIPIAPPPVPKPLPKAETKPIEQIFAPRPEVPVTPETPIFDTTPVEPKVAPPPDLGTLAGTGAGDAAPAKPVAALIGAIADPRYARDFQPEYPASEIRSGREGLVAVRVLIGTDGRVKAIEQIRATSPAFFDATRRQALSKWRFKPATRGGVPQESWKTVNLRFELT